VFDDPTLSFGASETNADSKGAREVRLSAGNGGNMDNVIAIEAFGLITAKAHGEFAIVALTIVVLAFIVSRIR